MEGESAPKVRDESEPTHSAPEEGERPGRRGKKPTESKTLPTTEAGDKVADQLRRKVIEMVDASALTEASRRRATAIDTTDYERGFDRIVSPSHRQNITVIVADVASAIGAGLIGYAINVYTGGSSSLLPGHIAFLAGTSMSVIGIVLKYATPVG